MIRTIELKDPDYPRLLKEIHAPPRTLFVKGSLLQEDEAAIAIVGTRAATPYGIKVARELAHELASRGVTIVSGLAEGIDAAAHTGALEAGGRTLAVVGHGLGTIYPSFHEELAQRITQDGCIISEFPMSEKPSPWNFPKRNRIISGLSLGVVVVEAPVRSGALITAKHAMEQGREVFAVPGPIGTAQSQGTHKLLKDGAKLVEDANDILEEVAPHLGPIVRSFESPAFSYLSPDEAAVLKALPLGHAAALESLSRISSMSPAKLMSVLTGLELKGLVKNFPARGFSRS